MTIWNQAQRMSRAAQLDVKGFSYRIYKGVRVTQDSEIFLYTIDNRLELAPEWVHTMAGNESLERAIHEVVKQKYLKNLEIVEARIKLEIATTNNHKRLSYLKELRKNLLIKYSEL